MIGSKSVSVHRTRGMNECVVWRGILTLFGVGKERGEKKKALYCRCGTSSQVSQAKGFNEERMVGEERPKARSGARDSPGASRWPQIPKIHDRPAGGCCKIPP